ncbi:MAG: hypothetical protein OEY49_01130, partial [Candidatus Heimdallarchaeota archaeon]|nr:hypothetical protein [Candidatus Heimdallarchaeota archaeon]
PPAPGIPSPKSSPPAPGGGPPAPGIPSPRGSGPPAPGGGPPAPASKETKSIVTPPLPSPSSNKVEAEREKSRRTRDISMPIEELNYPDESEEEEEIEIDNLISDKLLPKGMKDRSKVSMRHTHASWFDRMVPHRAYKLVIKISIDEMKINKSVTSVTTGERISEKTEQLVVDETSPMLTIRPEFPGSIVVPQERKLDITQDEVIAKFHITPLVLGKIDSMVLFMQNEKVIHTMNLQSKVINHRVSRWTAVLGGIVGIFPAVFAFLFNEQPTKFMNDRLETMLPMLKGLGYLVPGAMMGGLLGFGSLLYLLQKPKLKSRSVAFPR